MAKGIRNWIIGLAALISGCASYRVVEIQVPTQDLTQLIEEMSQIHEGCIKKEEWSVGQEDNYYRQASQIALKVINQKIPAVGSFNIELTNDNICSDEEAVGCTTSGLDSNTIQIRTDLLNTQRSPVFTIETIAHELGHKYKGVNLLKSDNEAVSEFFRHYLDEYLRVREWRNKVPEALSFEFAGSMSISDLCVKKPEDRDCPYKAGSYIAYKKIAESEGDFKEALERILGYEGRESTIKEYVRDFNDKKASEYKRRGSDYLHEIVKSDLGY